MNRTLRRPMFRIGGVAEGITSGLQPRQGYAQKPSRVLPDDLRKRKISDVLSGDTTLGEAQDLSRALAYKPKSDPWDYLGEVALNLVSTPTSGDLIGDIGTSMREPYSRYLDRKSTAAEQGYGSESSMFKTLIEAGATASGEGKTYAHRDKAAMVRENMDDQYKIYEQLDALDPEAEDYEVQRETLLKDLRTLKELISTDEFATAQLKYWGDDRNSRKLDSWITKELEKKLGVPLDLEGNVDHINAFNKRREEIMGDIRLGISPTFDFATGGRVGYQIGGDVMPGQPMQAAGPTDQGPAPEDMAGITYEELRARLPQEVSDDIVRLLANSAEALEDFAMIQTEQDINSFNKKYGVNLVLPSEG